jgi:DNA repair photolyase
MRIHKTTLRSGITRTKEFEKKGRASFAVNVGTKCGHGCLYCSTGAVLRMHRSFRDVGEDPFGSGYAIVDPTTPERVAEDARRLQKRGTVQLCTLGDAWAPEAKTHELGRRCLEAILSEPGWTVRILTKNAVVREDFDLIERHKDRVLVGLSITGTPEKTDVLRVIEPNGSPVEERMAVLCEAANRGLRTYGTLCPLLPGIAESEEQVEALVRFVVGCCAEEVFAEAVNARGRGMRLCEEALREAGCPAEAQALAAVRRGEGWSAYTVRLLSRLQQSMRQHSDISKLRFLLYPSRLLPEDEARIRADDAGVVWLGRRSATRAG